MVTALFITSAALVGCSDAEQDSNVEPSTTLAPEGKGAGSTASFKLSAAHAGLSTAVGGFDFSDITVTTGPDPVVIRDPATTSAPFWDTQSGTCWQHYEALGNPIPANTTCTIQVGFHPSAVGEFSATLTVTQCTSWSLDPTYGMISCADPPGGPSRSVELEGDGT
jgi:hypothetical protein